MSVLELICPDAHIFWHYISIKRDNDSQPNKLSWKMQIKSESARDHLLWATVLLQLSLPLFATGLTLV